MATPPVFSVGQFNTAAYMNSIGMWLVKSQTVGTGVSSVTVTGAFSADYDNYRIIYAGGVTSANDLAFQIRFANTAGHYANMRYDAWTGAAGTLATVNQNQAYFGLSGQATQTTMVLDVFNPYLSIFTNYSGFYTGNLYYGTGGGVYAQNSSITSFTIIAPSFTMTGGTIKIYGYRN